MNVVYESGDAARIEQLVRMALEEDVGPGDVTTDAMVPKGLVVAADIAARGECVVAGLKVARMVFEAVDSSLEFTPLLEDGARVDAGTTIANVQGEASSILTAERTVLNFLQRLSGVATLSAEYAAAAAGAGIVVLDTRKTTPGWRVLEKMAVRAGGSSNHRFGLYDMVMIKDNHRHMAALDGPGGIARAVSMARKARPELKIEVEADSPEEAMEAIEAGADRVLLDNMTNEQMREVAKINAGRAELEASGCVTLERIPAIAATGVDFVSVGAVTHSAKAVDIGLDFV